MDELQFIGESVKTIITLGSFVAIVMKFDQPINELRVVIQKLNDNIDALKNDNTQQNKRIEKHGEQIDSLGHRVNKLETKVDLYHKD